MRVNEVSDVVGFGGISTFNKVFKEETGMTPSEYTESIAK
jgi:AraC-like DNA-binding protein